MAKQKPHLNIVVIGHVDHGKSTTIGRMMYDAGAIPEKVMEELKKLAKEYGKEGFEFAYYTDVLKEERERGVTIDVSFKKFETPKYEITIIDAPGHQDYVKNMIKGTAQADAAVLVVAADDGVNQQTVEHAFLAKVFGIKQMIVAINKMDKVGYDQKRFEEVKKQVEDLLKQAGYDMSKVIIIPISAWEGENIIKKPEKMTWWNGPTLFEALDSLEIPPQPVDKPLRLPINDVYNIKGVGTVPTGRVITGKLKVGDKVIFIPGKTGKGVEGEVKSIEMHHEQIQEAVPGDNIGFNVRGIGRDDVERGDMCGHPGENQPRLAEEFVATIFVLQHPGVIAPGYTPVIHVHTANVPAELKEIRAKIDPKSGQITEQSPDYIQTGDAAITVWVPKKPLVIESAQEFPEAQLSSFAVRDMGKTVAVGRVNEVKKK